MSPAATCFDSVSPPSIQEKLKLGYLEQLPGKLRLFSTFLGDRKWFAGEKVRPPPPGGAHRGVPVSSLVLFPFPPPLTAHLCGFPHV